MNIVEKKDCFLIEGFFPPGIIAGFTKNTLSGSLPDDMRSALSFLDTPPDISWLTQEHSSGVKLVSQPGCYNGDGIFTDSSNHAVVVRTADCLPLFFGTPGPIRTPLKGSGISLALNLLLGPNPDQKNSRRRHPL